MLFIQEALTYGNGILQHALDVMNGCSVEVKEALILLLLSNDEVNKGMTKQFFEENPKLKGIPPIQTVVEFICEDNFKEKVPCDDTTYIFGRS